MIEPQHAVNIVLKEAARSGRADETMVLVTERSRRHCVGRAIR